MTSIHRRNYSDPIPHYVKCESCMNHFKKTQQHFDEFYDKSHYCSWNCVVSMEYEMEEIAKAKARIMIRMFWEEMKNNEQ